MSTPTGPARITDPQLRKLNVLLTHCGYTDRDRALAVVSRIIGRTVTTRKDLTLSEAHTAIDTLAAVEPPPQVTVQEAVRRVMHDIGQIGVGKDGWNQTQNYRFRGIDQFVNSLSPILARHGVVLLPRCDPPTVTEHPTARGGIQFMCILRVRWRIVGPAGDSFTAVTVGQALDTSDKAANKAMSAAFKYLLGQVFAVPNIGWSEQDAEHPTVDKPPAGQAPSAPADSSGADRKAAMDRIAAIAREEGMTVEALTTRFRQGRGDMTFDAFRTAPVELLNYFIRQAEAQQAADSRTRAEADRA